MVICLEGTGKEGDYYREVKYFFDLDEHGGTHGGMIGKIDPADDARAAAESVKQPSPTHT